TRQCSSTTRLPPRRIPSSARRSADATDSSLHPVTPHSAFAGRTLVITGGTGTFGNAVLTRFLDAGLKEIRIFSRDEKKQDDMRREYGNPILQFHLGDVRTPDSLREVMVGAD